MTRASSAVLGVVSGLVMGALSGCGVPYMKPTDNVPLQPPPNTGMVVFVRPSTWGGNATADILDETGHWVGRTSGGARFVVVEPPGPHMFTIWGENTDVVQVDVAPGHIYFVEVGITPGWLTAQFHLYAISPRTPTWAKRDDWMGRTRPMLADAAGGQALLSGKEMAVQERLRRAREHLTKYQGTPEADKHFIGPTDGI